MGFLKNEITLNTSKYDGSLHYRFATQEVMRGSNVIALYRGPDVKITSYRGTFDSGSHALQFFYSDTFYNIAVAWDRDWKPFMHYVNIATPASWHDGHARAIDMDLDLIRKVGSDSVIIDDEDEFEEHTSTYGYPAELVDECRFELERIHNAMVERVGIMSDAIYQWRPGRSIPRDLFAPL